MTKEELLDMVGKFTWSFGHLFHIETKAGCFEWSDPDYDGDNTIRPCGSYKNWVKKHGIPYGRAKGRHVIRGYCGENWILVDNV